ncbi:MAG TPA: AAA family ATPase [Gaiellaceae bacterium]|nr:AAA family ATPase [Gaiellaceae bacterium]
MLVGRDAERARIDALLEAGRRGRTGTLVLVGEPGIGKTALLDDAVAAATGMRTLRVTAVEAESTLPFAGLHALLLPLADSFAQLDPPQERALRLALALDDGDGPDVLAVNAGTLSVLADAAGRQPLLVAIDDAQWLDPPSADALGFALRRLQGEDIVCLIAVRSGEPSAFDRGFERLDVEPLPGPDAHELLTRRVEEVPPALVERMLELARGNPLALLELPVSLAGGDSGGAATATDRVRRAFAARLDLLPDESRRALVLAAAEPDAGAVRRAAIALGLGAQALAPAETAGLVQLDVEGIAFRHPIVRSLAYSSVDPASRREAHAALADALTDESSRDRRAWHLAAAATEPDEELATLLELTADRAEARGGHGAASLALERAARLSVDGDATARRLTRAARLAFWAGDGDRGIDLADEAITFTDDPGLRAEAALESASIRGAQSTGWDAALVESISVEQLDPDLATRLLIALVGLYGAAFDAAGAVLVAEQLEQAARGAGPWWRPRGLATAAAAHLAVADRERFDRLLAEVERDDAPASIVALDLMWAERYDLARRALSSTLREGRAAGNRLRVIWNQACVAQLELRLGRLREAQDAAAEAITTGDACGMRNWAGIARSALAGVHAWRGEVEACRTAAAESLRAADDARSTSDALFARGTVGLLALGLGRYDEVVDVLASAETTWAASSLVEPSAVPFAPDLVEAHLHLGNRDEAQAVLERFRRAAEQARRQWALAAVARCEGLLAADADAEPFERSLALLEGSPLTLERARTQLAFGERLRRAGRRRDARRHLREAHAAFAAVDAEPWADRAAAELRATGEVVGPRTPDRRSQLSPQELQIARLAGDGLTNKEIAAQLYLSPKTIEYHLANAYRKVGVHSRIELARAIVEH